MRNDSLAGKYPAENLNALTGLKGDFRQGESMAINSNARGADKIQPRPCRICGNIFQPLSFSGRICKRPECRIEALRRKAHAAATKRTAKRRSNRRVSDEELEQRLEAYFERVRCDVPRSGCSPIVDMKRITL